MKTPTLDSIAGITVSLLAVLLLGSAGWAGQELITPATGLDISIFETRDAKLEVKQVEGKSRLRLTTGHASKWPGFSIKPEKSCISLGSALYLELAVINRSDAPVRVGLRADSETDGAPRRTVQRVDEVAPAAHHLVRLDLPRPMPKNLSEKLFGMRGYPAHLSDKTGLDLNHVVEIIVFVADPKTDVEIDITGLRATGTWSDLGKWTNPSATPFPFIDQFGQYCFREWAGKTHQIGDLRQRRDAETADLRAHPGPDGWDQYGGWQAGPQLPATGSFRVAIEHDRWWLVDPAGHLFWSHGVDCVHAHNATTPITDRRPYFAALPAQDSPLAVFYGQMGRAPHGYYAKDGRFRTYNFTGANLYHKYGNGWRTEFFDLCHQRLRSWGLNTIGNWSDWDIYRRHRTPYVITLNAGRKPIAGSTGYWGKFPDPFDPTFARVAAKSAERVASDIQTPWCLGVFMDNELAWGKELSLATATLASPADQPAKQAFLRYLKVTYDDIGAVNRAWQTKHASWQALLESSQPPAADAARTDLEHFESQLAEKYFAVCRKAVKDVAPNKLYLGCRFAWVNDRVIRAAAKYCDVISFNKYTNSVADLQLPAGIDKPTLIGEFHFGALDRGLFHTGLRITRDQQDRARAYTEYVTGALRNRQLVGTHWFQFGDQATTGRFDGENYQIGFTDVCDTPYAELVDASRSLGNQLYTLRLEAD